MKERRELLQKFIEENFNVNFFKIEWEDDFMVNLTDYSNVTLTLICVKDTVIWTAIDKEKYLTYELSKDLTGNTIWKILPQV